MKDRVKQSREGTTVNGSEIPEHYYPNQYQTLLNNTVNHEMTILHEDGLYRHLRFQKPGTNIWYFDLITWPGSLAIRGDINSGYLFSRTPDMLKFFDQGQPDGYINDTYWAEKLEACDESIEEYSVEKLAHHVNDSLDDIEDPADLDAFWKERYANVNETIGEDGKISPELRQAIIDDVEENCGCESDAYDWLEDHSPVFGADTWEWNLRTYKHGFILALHAILWGAKKYHAFKERRVTEETTGDTQHAANNLLTQLGLNERIRLAKNPLAPTQVLNRLSKDEDPAVRLDVAENLYAPTEALDRLSGDEFLWVRHGVACNPLTPTQVLDRLSEDENPWVRHGVACNPNTPTSVLTRLSEDENPDVRRRVARHPNTPAEVLDRLSGDEDSSVRQGVAVNLNAPAGVLTRLSKDQDPNVRWEVARNPNTPTEILTQLGEDQDPSVWRIAAQALEARANAN